MMKDSNVQLNHGKSSLRAYMQPKCRQANQQVQALKKQLDGLRAQAVAAVAGAKEQASDSIRKAGTHMVNRLKRAEGSAKRATARAAGLEVELKKQQDSTNELSQKLRDEFNRTADNISRFVWLWFGCSALVLVCWCVPRPQRPNMHHRFTCPTQPNNSAIRFECNSRTPTTKTTTTTTTTLTTTLTTTTPIPPTILCCASDWKTSMRSGKQS